MKLESRKDEQANEPLTTAALAHPEERREPENRAQVRTHDPLTPREPETAVRDAGRADGGPALIPPRDARTGEAGQIGTREAAANDRQPGPAAKLKEEERNAPLFRAGIERLICQVGCLAGGFYR